MLLLVFNLETEHAVNQESQPVRFRGRCFMYSSDSAQCLGGRDMDLWFYPCRWYQPICSNVLFLYLRVFIFLVQSEVKVKSRANWALWNVTCALTAMVLMDGQSAWSSSQGLPVQSHTVQAGLGGGRSWDSLVDFSYSTRPGCFTQQQVQCLSPQKWLYLKRSQIRRECTQ